MFVKVSSIFLLLQFLPISSGFVSGQSWKVGPGYTSNNQLKPSKSQLCMINDLFENFKRMWGDGDNNGDDDLGDEDAAGTSLIASVPVKSIKPGGLRLFLMFYMMGMQNTPDRNSWRADQPSGEEYIVEMLYHDATGMITVELLDDEVRITRCGSTPSMAYLMQEAVIVQGVLDELDQCAFDESVPEADRLLVPTSKDSINSARESLAFG